MTRLQSQDWPTEVPVLDEHKVHELLHQVDQQEPGQHQDLGHGQAGVRERLVGHSGNHDLRVIER